MRALPCSAAYIPVYGSGFPRGFVGPRLWGSARINAKRSMYRAAVRFYAAVRRTAWDIRFG